MNQLIRCRALIIICLLTVGLQLGFSQEHTNHTKSKLNNTNQTLSIDDVSLFVVQQVDSGNLENVKQILEYGINPNIDWYGTTALMYAAQRGHYEITREFVAYGAELDIKDPNGLTALHFATSSFNDSIAELLVLNGANPHPVNDQGVSPLHYASAYGYPYMAYILLYYGAHIDSTDSYGNTPLLASVYSGALETSDYLLESWAEVDKGDNNGITPLMVAAQFNDTTMMRLLTDYGADINKYSNDGITALALAIANKSEEAILFLLAQNASIENLSPEISYADLAKRNGLKELALALDKIGSPLSKEFQLHHIAPHIKTIINHNDFLMSIGTEVALLPYGINIGLDLGLRPYQKAIIVEDIYATYQFFERRYMASLSVTKDMAQFTTPKKSLVSFSVGLKGYTSWANYNIESSAYQAKSHHFITPEIRATITKNGFYLAASCHMLTMDHLREQPLSFSIATGFTIDTTRPKLKKKKVEWY